MHIRFSTTLFFIRHGQTPRNAHNQRQGVQHDDYLDTEGILQTEKLGKIVKHLELDVLMTSYLHRAEETAVIVNRDIQEPIKILHDYRLRERDFGSLTDRSEKEWDKLLPNHEERELTQMYDYRPFGGESVDDVRQRAMSAILDIIENNDHQNVGIITHAGIIRLLLFHFPDIPRIYHANDRSELNVGNTDIYEWEITSSALSTVKSLLT